MAVTPAVQAPAGCALGGPGSAGSAPPAPARRPVAVWSPHPFAPAAGRRLVYDALLPGETLADYLERVQITRAIAGLPVVLTIDGHRVPRALWPRVRPKHGTLIGIQALLQGGGGGGGKNPIATLASIAIMVFNPGAGILGALGANPAVSFFGVIGWDRIINFGLGLVASAIFPPPRPQIAEAQGQRNDSTSPTYSLSGGSNRARPYEPLPMIAGTHRVFPDLGARTYTEFEGEDQVLFQVFDFGYNTVALSDYKIGNTPLTDYSDYEIEVSGTDGALTLFPGNVDSIAGGALTVAAGWIQRTSSASATRLAIEIVGSLYVAGANGVEGNQCLIEAQYRAVGSPTWLTFHESDATPPGINITSSSRAPVRRTYTRSVAEGTYEVRVRRITAEESGLRVSELTWSQLRTYQPDTADYNGRKRVGLKIRASGQLNGQVAEFSAIARASCEAWTGAAWVAAETSNPAAWVRAIALGKFVTIDGVSRRVWGAGLASARVDHAAFAAWFTWCASKSLTFNGVFDRPMSAADMMHAVAACGRGSLTWGNGKLGVVYDQANQPVTAVFGMSNIIRDSFEIRYETEQIADEVIVNFVNPDLDWQRDTVRCLVPGTVTPTRTATIDLFGCTDLDMAGRAGNLYAAQNLYRTRRLRWHADFEGMTLARGDVVQLSHDLATYDYSGRLVEGSTASVLQLDRAVPLVPGTVYITLVKPDGTFATHQAVGGTGEATSLTLSSALAFDPGADPDHPPYDYRWLFGASATPGRLVKIDSIRPLDEATVEIVAIDEDPLFYLAESRAYFHSPPRPNFGGPAVANLQVTEVGVRAANGYLVQLIVTWDASNDYAGAELFAAVNDDPEQFVGRTAGRALSLTVSDGDAVALRLVATSSLGRLGRLTTLTATHATAFAAAFPPADVTGFYLSGDTFTWTASADADVVGYELRFAYGQAAVWESAAPLHGGLITEIPWTPATLPGGAVTFLIKAVDAAGGRSENAAAIYASRAAVAPAKILEEIDLDALGYPGTITGGSVSGGDLVADSSTLAWSGDDTAPFWGAADTATFWPSAAYALMTYAATVTPTAARAGSTLTLALAIAGDPYTIEYRIQGPGAFWGSDAAAGFWGSDDAAQFWDDPPEYSTWPGRVAATNEPFDFRFSTAAGATQGEISTLTVQVDVPLVSEIVEDAIIAATTGSRLVLGTAFFAIDAVQVTVQADGNGAISARVEDKSASLGPLITARDAAGTAVAGLIDATVTGYL